jgi:hypothetical protein
MNSINLSFFKHDSATLTFGVSDGKHTLTATAMGVANKIIIGEIGGRQKTTRFDDDSSLTMPISAKGFTAYWMVENHDDLELIRICVDTKSHTVDIALHLGENTWKECASMDLNVLPNPEFRFYNYRSEIAAKTLNIPKRSRGRPRKPVSE